MKKLYSSQLNLMKLISAILIVYQHVISGFLVSPDATKLIAITFGSILDFSRFAVVLFMIISGFLMIKSYENISTKNFYKFKAKKIFLLYISANVFYMMVNYFNEGLTLHSLIIGFLTGETFYHLWYLNLLVKIYLIFPLIRFIVLKICKSSKWLYFTALLILIEFVIISNAYDLLYSSPSKLAQLYLTYLDRSLLIWTFYFILGGIIYKKLEKILFYANKYKIAILIAFTLDFIYINYKILKPILNGTSNSYVTGSPSTKLLYPFILLSFFSIYIICSMIIEKNYFNAKALINTSSKYILPLYIIHPFALFITKKLQLSTKSLSTNIIITLSLTYIISIFLIWSYLNIKNKIKGQLIKEKGTSPEDVIKTAANQ